MRSHAQPYEAMRSHAQPCETMRNHAKPCGTVCSHAKPCQAMRSRVQPCAAMRSHEHPCAAVPPRKRRCSRTYSHNASGNHTRTSPRSISHSLAVSLCEPPRSPGIRQNRPHATILEQEGLRSFAPTRHPPCAAMLNRAQPCSIMPSHDQSCQAVIRHLLMSGSKEKGGLTHLFRRTRLKAYSVCCIKHSEEGPA